MLLSQILRSDVEFIARESGYQGSMEDLRRAASTNRIHPLKIPVGTRLPAMSSRKDGKAILLRDILWAGAEPIDAYEFYFSSNGRRYRVVSPKACANFWVEDQGKEKLPALALACNAPPEVSLRRPVEVCLTLSNTGEENESQATVTLLVPAVATVVSAGNGGVVMNGQVVWTLEQLPIGGSNQLCAVFTPLQAGTLAFAPVASGSRAPQVQSRCETRVSGIPAVLLEVVDLVDPIEVGGEVTYEITVLNQGGVALTNMKLVCTLAAGQQFVSGDGTTPVQAQDQTITTEALPILVSKETAKWRVTVKAMSAGDVRFTTELTSNEFQSPVKESEATQQY